MLKSSVAIFDPNKSLPFYLPITSKSQWSTKLYMSKWHLDPLKWFIWAQLIHHIPHIFSKAEELSYGPKGREAVSGLILYLLSASSPLRAMLVLSELTTCCESVSPATRCWAVAAYRIPLCPRNFSLDVFLFLP